jgi:VIT1/CCC1 family predicted Fe2+/Mn2+ transporter
MNRHPSHAREPQGAAASRWPKALRRGPMETLATVLIAAGVLMLLQPFSLTLYGYSFVTTLIGVIMFTFVTKFPE